MSYIAFLGYVDIIWRYHMVMWYGYIIWWCDIRHQMFDFWWILKHKFHGLVGPPGAIFEKKQQPAKPRRNLLDIFRFSRMALNHVLTVPQYSRRRELSESCLNIFYLPICDRFTAHRSLKKNFGPNVRYCFFGIHFSSCFKKESIRFMLPVASGGNFWKKQQPAKPRRNFLIFKNSLKSGYDSARI